MRAASMRVVYVHATQLDSEKANVVQVLQMCRALVRAGHEVKLLIPCVGTEDAGRIVSKMLGELPEFDIVPFKCRTLFGRLANLGQVLGVRYALRRIRASWQPDCCIVRHPVLLGPAVKSRVPVVFESHSPFGHNRSRVLDYVRRRRVVQRSREANVRIFVAISNKLAEFWIRQGVPREKVVVLHDGFDVGMFETKLDRNTVRAELGLPLECPIATYAGSLYEDREIESIFKLADLFPHVMFVLVGGPEERRRHLASQLRKQENIRLVGRVSPGEVPLYLAAADILLMVWGQDVPTINYCSPLKMFEYMAAGRIIVGHGYPTILEVMKHGVHGLLATPGSFDELRDLFEEALEQGPSSRIPYAARMLAFEKYTWQRRTEMLSNALRTAMEPTTV